MGGKYEAFTGAHLPVKTRQVAEAKVWGAFARRIWYKVMVMHRNKQGKIEMDQRVMADSGGWMGLVRSLLNTLHADCSCY